MTSYECYEECYIYHAQPVLCPQDSLAAYMWFLSTTDVMMANVIKKKEEREEAESLPSPPSPQISSDVGLD